MVARIPTKGGILGDLIAFNLLSRFLSRRSEGDRKRIEESRELIRSDAIAKSRKSALICEPLVKRPIWRKVDLLETDTSGSRASNLPRGK